MISMPLLLLVEREVHFERALHQLSADAAFKSNGVLLCGACLPVTRVVSEPANACLAEGVSAWNTGCVCGVILVQANSALRLHVGNRRSVECGSLRLSKLLREVGTLFPERSGLIIGGGLQRARECGVEFLLRGGALSGGGTERSGGFGSGSFECGSLVLFNKSAHSDFEPMQHLLVVNYSGFERGSPLLLEASDSRSFHLGGGGGWPPVL